MRENPYQFSVDTLVASTQAASMDALTLYGPMRKELLANWGFVLEMSKPPILEGRVDWGQVRSILWDNIPEEILFDRGFAVALSSVFTELCGQREGMKGLRTVLRRWESM